MKQILVTSIAALGFVGMIGGGTFADWSDHDVLANSESGATQLAVDAAGPDQALPDARMLNDSQALQDARVLDRSLSRHDGGVRAAEGTIRPTDSTGVPTPGAAIALLAVLGTASIVSGVAVLTIGRSRRAGPRKRRHPG